MLEITKLLKNKNIKRKLFTLINNCSGRARDKLKKNKIKEKKDGSIVTEADKDIDQMIYRELSKISSSIPIISEENNNNEKYFLQDIFWLVDPIDGTSGYVKGEDNYTINIALVYEGNPVLGIISNPPTNTIWFGCNNEAIVLKGSSEKRIKTNNLVNNTCKIIMSKTFDASTNNFIKKIKNTYIQYCSSSIKFCKIAQGEANIYPRLTSISKWDIAAGEAILKASGGIVLNEKGNILNYRTESVATGKFFALSSIKIWDNIINNILDNN